MSKRMLAACQPEPVFRYFEDICGIPHPSGHEEKLADYVEAFARERGLTVYRDEVNNVFIKKPATPGHEGAGAVMLQGHLDMVPEKDSGVAHDFLTDGLKLSVSGEWIRAGGTTLGGDDGIAVAIMLALLDAAPDPHPALECLFTVSEETGLNGAWAFDPDAAGLTARTPINLDSENEGVITAGCAGGVRTDITVPVTFEPRKGQAVEVVLDGCAGGHSGVQIIEGHINAIKALGQLLVTVRERFDFDLVSLSGGGKDNAIPRAARAVVALHDEAYVQDFCAAITAEAELLRAEPSTAEADRAFTCTASPSPVDAPAEQMDAATTWNILHILHLVRDGVLAMSAYVPGLVAFSRNLGIVSTDRDEAKVVFSFSSRSASNHQLDATQRELETLASAFPGVTAAHHARYPGWDYAPVSPLREVWVRESERLFGVTPTVEVIHAGLECGILCDKRPGLDIISVGPDMRDIHTPREQLSIPSTARTYALVCAVLQALSEE